MRERSLLQRLSLAFFVVAIAEAVGLGIASFWALSDLNRLNAELVEITRSLEATRDLSRDLGRLLYASQQVRIDPYAGSLVRERLAAAQTRLEGCASSTCHGARTAPAEMVSSIAPSFQLLSERSQALFESRHTTAADLGAWSAESERLIEDIQGRLALMASALAGRVERLRQSSEQVPLRARRSFLLLISSGVGLAWAAASFTTSRLLQPIGRLLEGIRGVGAGEFTHKVEVDGTQEIRELADSFNDMAVRLQRYQEELEEANRTLEQRVRERTEELKRSHEVLHRSEKLTSIGLLTSGIAHEINNPLTGILMNVELLLEEQPEHSATRRMLQKISDDGERCKRIIDDLRAFSREKVLVRADVDLEALLERTLGLLDVILRRCAISVERTAREEALVVHCDAGRIQQVFTNVILNAADAMSPRGVLRVASARRDGWAVLTFADDGCGIPAENLARVFDPFFTTKAQGTGLGLSICYGIISDHGGAIEVHSPRAQDPRAAGTTVTISLRLAAPAEEAARG